MTTSFNIIEIKHHDTTATIQLIRILTPSPWNELISEDQGRDPKRYQNVVDTHVDPLLYDDKSLFHSLDSVNDYITTAIRLILRLILETRLPWCGGVSSRFGRVRQEADIENDLRNWPSRQKKLQWQGSKLQVTSPRVWSITVTAPWFDPKVLFKSIPLLQHKKHHREVCSRSILSSCPVLLWQEQEQPRVCTKSMLRLYSKYESPKVELLHYQGPHV